MADRRYWLFKSEPTAYSFADLLAEENQTAEWDGVRNYQVRNYMRDDMRVGDGVLFYHSSAKPMAVIGLATSCARVTRIARLGTRRRSITTPRALPTTPYG